MPANATTTRVLRAVPGPAKPRTETEDKLWQALQDNPDSSAITLSTAAGIGKSTAPKILNRWEQEGLVVRTVGVADSGPRPADRWSITADDDPTADEPPAAPADAPLADGVTQDGDSAQPREKSVRLAPGALRGMVEDYLRDNTGAFSPSRIGKELERSAGAVHNALEKLVRDGYAERTSEKPKKYSLAARAASEK